MSAYTGCADALAIGLIRCLAHARELAAHRDELTSAAGKAGA